MRSFLPAIGISAALLPLLVLACTPKVRSDLVSAGGAGGAGAATTTDSVSATGPTTGAGGSGGSAPMGSCKKSGSAFDILGAAELGAGTQLDDRLYLLPDNGKRQMVHVVIEDKGQNRTLIRSVLNDPNPLGNFTQHTGLRPNLGVADNTQVSIYGSINNSLTRVDFPPDPDNGVGFDGVANPLPTPIECTQLGHINRVVYTRDGASVKYLLVCPQDFSEAGVQSVLFAGDTVGMPTAISTNDSSAPEMSPQLYRSLDGAQLVTFEQDQGAGLFVSYGVLPQDLVKLQPFHLTSTAGVANGIFAAPPLPGNDGVALIAAFFSKADGKGQFWGGPVLAKDYASLAQTPPPSLAVIQDVNMFADIAPTFNPTWDATGIYAAGAAQDKVTVRFSWLTRQGKPLIFGQEVYTSPDATVIVANAAPLDDFTRLVVWVEQSGSSPPTYLVRGQKLICQLKT